MSSFSGVVGIFPVDFVIAFFSFTVVIRMSPFKYKNITSNIKSEMIHTISIALNKHMLYNGLNKKLKSVQREGNKPFLGWKSALLHTYYMFF